MLSHLTIVRTCLHNIYIAQQKVELGAQVKVQLYAHIKTFVYFYQINLSLAIENTFRNKGQIREVSEWGKKKRSPTMVLCWKVSARS